MEQITDVKTTEMNLMPSAGSKRYWWKAIASFLMVLFTMPLGHALMIIMEHVMNETVLHYSAFAMGAGRSQHSLPRSGHQTRNGNDYPSRRRCY